MAAGTGCLCRSRTSKCCRATGLIPKTRSSINLAARNGRRKRAKLKQRIRDMAEQLIAVAAARAIKPAEKLEAPEGVYEEFAARFPFEETEDQLNAISDVMEDMTSGRPMDRLICGDVGFGKTEVAMRAALIASMSGRQVAIVAPTTLACQAALFDLRQALCWPAGGGAPTLAPCDLQGSIGDAERAGGWHGGYRYRHPRTARQVRIYPESGFADRR